MTSQVNLDELAMGRALELARIAADHDEVPVGAVVTLEDRIIGEGWNQQISSCDPTAHAEIIAIRNAALSMRNYRLPGARLYVTLEPCSMCCGAVIHARIDELIFAASEPRAGAVLSARQLLDESGFNHRVAWRQLEVYGDASGDLLRKFFRARR